MHLPVKMSQRRMKEFLCTNGAKGGTMLQEDATEVVVEVTVEGHDAVTINRFDG